MAILVLHASLPSSRAVVLHHLKSFADYLHAPVIYHHVNAPVDDEMRCFRWKAVILNYCFLQVRQSQWRELLLAKFDFVARFPGLKIAITMDDAFMSGILEDIILRFGCEHVFTPLHAFVNILYPRLIGRVEFEPMLTGYVNTAVAREWKKKSLPHSERPIDVGTRVRLCPASHGQFALEKAHYASAFLNAVDRTSMRIDISTRAEDSFSAADWYHFLGRCRATIGMKGGYGLVDPDGSCRTRCDEYVSRHRLATYEEIRTACFPHVDDQLRIAVESPRLFESAITFTTQIMPPDTYIGDLQPWVHYIPLGTKLAGLDDALEALRDERFCESVAKRCYAALVDTEEFKSEQFVSRLARIIGVSRRIVDDPRAPLHNLPSCDYGLPARSLVEEVAAWRQTLTPFIARALGLLLLSHSGADFRAAANCVFTKAAKSSTPILVSTLYQQPLSRFLNVPSLLVLSAVANMVRSLGAAELWHKILRMFVDEKIDAAVLMPWDFANTTPEVKDRPTTGMEKAGELLDAGLFDEAEEALLTSTGSTSPESWAQIATLRIARGQIDRGVEALLNVLRFGRVEEQAQPYVEAAMASIIVIAVPLGLRDTLSMLMKHITSHERTYDWAVQELAIFAPDLLPRLT